jgi:hypothetical protein
MVVIVLVCCPIMLFTKPCSACYCPVAAGMPEYAEGAEAHHAQEQENYGSNPNGYSDEQQLLQSQANDEGAFF